MWILEMRVDRRDVGFQAKRGQRPGAALEDLRAQLQRQEPTLQECVLRARKGWQQTKSEQG